MTRKILIACIGNIFLGDDAFGVEVARRLEQMPLPNNVVIRDFGIRSYDLAYALMDDWELVIMVDAVPFGSEPGTVYTIDPELPNDGTASEAFDAHTMNPVSVLQLVTALGGKVGRILVVGCEPSSVEPNENGQTSISPAVQSAIDVAIEVIEELVSCNNKAIAA
jgi:hydrogenase maturation protease